jgi:hypothetical protein
MKLETIVVHIAHDLSKPRAATGEDPLLAAVGHHQRLDDHRLHAAKAMHPPHPLLHLHRVPRDVEVDEAARDLEVDALAARTR